MENYNPYIIKKNYSPLNKIKLNSIKSMSFDIFICRLSEEDLFNLKKPHLDVITEKIFYNTIVSSKWVENFLYLLAKLSNENLSFFYDFIYLINNHLLSNNLSKNNRKLLESYQSTIDKIENNTNENIKLYINEFKNKVSDALISADEILEEKSKSFKDNLLSSTLRDKKDYVLLVDNIDNSDNKTLKEYYYVEHRVIWRLNTWKGNNNKSDDYRITIDWKRQILNQKYVIDFLARVLEYNPEILVWQIILNTNDNRLHIHKDFIEEYMKNNPISSNNVEEILQDLISIVPEVYKQEENENLLSQDLIHKLMEVIFIKWWFEVTKTKNPFIPNKIISRVVFEEQHIINIRNFIENQTKLSL